MREAGRKPRVAGGVAGKLASGWLGARLRVRATFITEGLTAVGDLGVCGRCL